MTEANRHDWTELRNAFQGRFECIARLALFALWPWRCALFESMFLLGAHPNMDFGCPFGVPSDSKPPKRGTLKNDEPPILL